MRKLFFLYVFALLLVSGLGATAAVEYEGYTNPAGTQFPIVIFDNVPINATKNGQPLTEDEQKAYFQDLKNCGFNVELWSKDCSLNNMTLMNKWTHYLTELDMGIILNSQGYCLTRSSEPGDASTPDSVLLKDNWEPLLRVMRNHSNNPDIWGFHVMDEPVAKNWSVPVYQLGHNDVAAIQTFDMVNEHKGSKVAYANFGVAFTKNWIGDFAPEKSDSIYVDNYESYLDYMVDLFDLKLLTFDIYPVISHSQGPDPVWEIKSFYYNSMDLYGRYCRDRKIPVWLVMLSVEHSYDGPGVDNDWKYPEITAGLLRLQAMNGLAFGMKGIVYWEYGARNEIRSNILFKSALYDINKMEKTPAWNAARSVNNDIKIYGAILQDATYDRSCIVTNDTADHYDGFEKFSNPFYGIISIKHSGKGVLLSHLTADDGEYIAIVNQDHLNSQKITIGFDPKQKYERVCIDYPSAPMGSDLIGADLVKIENCTLAPGEMILFKQALNKD